MPKPLTSLDIVLSVFNQEGIIRLVLEGILENTTTPFNLILIFDGCTDRSQEVALEYLKSAKCANLRELRVTTAPNVFETKANNIGFRMSKEDYAITVQDDMVIEEKGWERRLTYPLRAYDDIFAVSARNALNAIIDNRSPDPAYVDIVGREHLNFPRNTFIIRSAVNRGPLALRMDIMRKLNYLDESFYPEHLDDMDLCFRAYEKFGMKCGAYWINYRSDLKWGKTRQTNPSGINWKEVIRRNAELIRKNHQHFVDGSNRIRETRRLKDSDVDYVERDSCFVRAKKRVLCKIPLLRMYVSKKFNGLRVRAKRTFGISRN